MATREQLKRGGMRAYEWGRVKAALGVVWIVAPLTLFCALVTHAGEVCLCIGALLFAAGLYLRWRNRSGQKALSTGLAAGMLPLLAGVVLVQLNPFSADVSLLSISAGICLSTGFLSGLWLGVLAKRKSMLFLDGLTAAGIAALVASLGCAGLGATAVLCLSLALIVGSTATLMLRMN